MVGQGVGLVLQAVQQGFSAFQGDLAAWVPQLFDSWSTAEQAEIMTYFQQTQPPVWFSLAYPLQPEKMPSCAVSMEPGAEEPSADAFGMMQQVVPILDSQGVLTGTQQWQGITQHDRFDVSLRHGWNQKLLLWLDVIAWWSLLQQRSWLITQGFGTQVLARTGLEPDALYLEKGSVPVYRRTVSLTVRHQVGWYTPTGVVSAVTSSVTPT